MQNTSKMSFGQAMGRAAEAAPVLLLISMLGCFSFIGYTQFLFYTEEFSKAMGDRAPIMGALVAIMIQLCRLASGLSSSLHYKRGNVFSAITVFCFSVGLSFWEWHEIAVLSELIGGSNTLFLLQFCVVVSLALEFGLATTIEGEYTDENEFKEVVFSTNGAAPKKGNTKKLS